MNGDMFELLNPGITKDSPTDVVFQRAKDTRSMSVFNAFQPNVKAYIMLLELLVERAYNEKI